MAFKILNVVYRQKAHSPITGEWEVQPSLYSDSWSFNPTEWDEQRLERFCLGFCQRNNYDLTEWGTGFPLDGQAEDDYEPIS